MRDVDACKPFNSAVAKWIEKMPRVENFDWEAMGIADAASAKNNSDAANYVCKQMLLEPNDNENNSSTNELRSEFRGRAKGLPLEAIPSRASCHSERNLLVL